MEMQTCLTECLNTLSIDLSQSPPFEKLGEFLATKQMTANDILKSFEGKSRSTSWIIITAMCTNPHYNSVLNEILPNILKELQDEVKVKFCFEK